MRHLLPALLVALRALGDAPARSLPALAQRLGVSEADIVTMVTPLEAEAALVATVPAAAPGASPFCPRRHRDPAEQTGVRAARKKTIR